MNALELELFTDDAPDLFENIDLITDFLYICKN